MLELLYKGLYSYIANSTNSSSISQEHYTQEMASCSLD